MKENIKSGVNKMKKNKMKKVYKGNTYLEKAHGYHLCSSKPLANKQLLGVSFQLLIELVAKLHEHQKIKYDFISFCITVFFYFVAKMAYRCDQQKHHIEGRHTLAVHRFIKKWIYIILLYQKQMFFLGLFGSYLYLSFIYQMFRLGCQWPPSNLF